MPRILVVDDDSAVREMLSTMLGTLGHEVVFARDGAEALASLARQSADLLLTDIFMPGMEGLETIQRIRERYPKLRVVAITARVPDERQGDLLEIARKLGASATLRKPFTMRQLIDTLGKVAPELSPTQ